MTTCMYIFIGKNNFPYWILKLDLQDESYINIYLASLYFSIMTITTVGYGDITGDTLPEIMFQIFLLIIGNFSYSFIISYFSNYIIKINQKSINFEKKMKILNEIKLHHPNMSISIYKEVLRNLYNEQLYEKKDKQILFHCLPYSLKNKLIMEMYKPIIQNFSFFKEIHNSDFIVKVVTYLKPLLLIKEDIIINEGDFIKEIIFIKKGQIGLNLSIDLNNPEKSIQKYFNLIDFNKFNISNIKTTIINQKEKSKTKKNLLSKKGNSDSNNGIKDNIEDLKITEIKAREHFGDALMFLNERCPLKVKVRTKTAELFVLKKMEAIEIYSIYPNIWERINKKSLFNIEQIYLKITKKLIELSNKYKIKLHTKKLKKKKKSKQKTKGNNKNNLLGNTENLIRNKDNIKVNENDISKNTMNIEKNESLNEMRNSYHVSQNLDIKNISIEKESIIQEAATKAQKTQIKPIKSHGINNAKKNLIKANNENMNNINDYLSKKGDKPINNNTSKNNTDSNKYYKRQINEEISQTK